MEKQPSHLPLAIISVILSGLIFGLLGYWYGADVNSTTSPTSTASPTATVSASPVAIASPTPTSAATTLTNDQIFQEVASQFGLTKSGLAYFRIFGQDKVQYAIAGAPAGTNYVYKTSGTWKMAQQNASSVASCDSFANIPVNYRPVCVDSKGTTLYMGSSNSSDNYPPSTMVSYIGK